MDEYDLPTPDFSPLSLDANINTLNAGYDFSDLGGQPISNANSTPSTLNQNLSFLTSLFDNGIKAYNDIAQKTGLPLANGQPTAPAIVSAQAQQNPIFGGFTTAQLQLAGAALGFIVLLVVLRKKR